MVRRGPIGQAIGVARRDIQRIQDAQTVLQVADAGRQCGEDGRRQIAAGAPEAVTPRLLAMAQVQTLQGLLHRLVAGEAGPFMVAGGGADSGQLQVGLGLMQPVGGTIHAAIVAAADQGVGARWLPLSERVSMQHTAQGEWEIAAVAGGESEIGAAGGGQNVRVRTLQAITLPEPVRGLMRAAAKLMTRVAYRI